ncbi:MAG: RNA degradosome polyphosphate kinase, partial [Armatimonadetes bacterium]|nr:RNA degradosome polyphosphate kinase [Armatimonadota bacterium]
MAHLVKAREKYNCHERYVNREFSWLQFNSRVLFEAENPDNPLLERCKFLSIFESNLDEFYMVRVSGLIEQVEQKITALTPDGLTPDEQLELIADEVRDLRQRAAHIWSNDLSPALAGNGIVIRKFTELTKAEQSALTEHFQNRVFNVCTPLMLDPNPTFPFISNLSLNLAVELK